MGIGRASLSASAQPAIKYTAKQYLRRWWKSLAHLSEWQYTLRITLCLLAATGVDWLWPHHHGYWVLITVVILVRRDLRSSKKLMFQRAIGTVIGVLATSLLLLGMSSIWAAVAMMGNPCRGPSDSYGNQLHGLYGCTDAPGYPAFGFWAAVLGRRCGQVGGLRWQAAPFR